MRQRPARPASEIQPEAAGGDALHIRARPDAALREIGGIDVDRRPALIEVDRHDGRRFYLGGFNRLIGQSGAFGCRRVLMLGGRRVDRFALCRLLILAFRLVHGGNAPPEFAHFFGGRFHGGLVRRRCAGILQYGFGDRRRRDRLRRGEKLVGVGRRRAPNRAAARAAHLASEWPQACQLHVIGGSAGRADDQHRRISSAAPSPRP